jgi:hypothetical protein
MTEAFASAVAVTVPILALAAGAEVRAVRERVRRPDEEWEKAFAAYQAEHELDLDKPHAEALKYLIGVPAVKKAFIVERVAAIAGAFTWLVVFILLTIAELLSLVWLGDGAHGAAPGIAEFSVVTIGIALAALVVTPAVYLLFPLLLSVDLVPHGLRKAVGPKITTVSGRDLLRHMLREFETSVEHAAREAQEAKQAGRAAGTAAGERNAPAEAPDGEPRAGEAEAAEPAGH